MYKCKSVYNSTAHWICSSPGLIAAVMADSVVGADTESNFFRSFSLVSLLISTPLSLPTVRPKAGKCGEECRAGVVIILVAKHYKLTFKKLKESLETGSFAEK